MIWKRWIAVLAIICLSEYFGHVESAITFISPENGNGTAAGYVAEGSTSGTVYTLNATGDVGPVTYNLTSQTVADTFEMAMPVDGVISVASGAVIDYETNMEHVLTIEVDDSSTTGTMTLTVRISDENDNTPSFTETSYLFTVPDGSSAGTTVGSVIATDNDGSAPNNVVSFAITGGSGNLTFEINNATGEITIASGNTLSSETKSAFSLTITGTDNGTPSLDTSTTVMVGVCSTTTSGNQATPLYYSLGLVLASFVLAVRRDKLL